MRNKVTLNRQVGNCTMDSWTKGWKGGPGEPIEKVELGEKGWAPAHPSNPAVVIYEFKNVKNKPQVYSNDSSKYKSLTNIWSHNNDVAPHVPCDADYPPTLRAKLPRVSCVFTASPFLGGRAAFSRTCRQKPKPNVNWVMVMQHFEDLPSKFGTRSSLALGVQQLEYSLTTTRSQSLLGTGRASVWSFSNKIRSPMFAGHGFCSISKTYTQHLLLGRRLAIFECIVGLGGTLQEPGVAKKGWGSGCVSVCVCGV